VDGQEPEPGAPTGAVGEDADGEPVTPPEDRPTLPAAYPNVPADEEHAVTD
jgi:hypothetical protein